jgi:hypothetical protein
VPPRGRLRSGQLRRRSWNRPVATSATTTAKPATSIPPCANRNKPAPWPTTSPTPHCAYSCTLTLARPAQSAETTARCTTTNPPSTGRLQPWPDCVRTSAIRQKRTLLWGCTVADPGPIRSQVDLHLTDVQRRRRSTSSEQSSFHLRAHRCVARSRTRQHSRYRFVPPQLPHEAPPEPYAHRKTQVSGLQGVHLAQAGLLPGAPSPTRHQPPDPA